MSSLERERRIFSLGGTVQAGGGLYLSRQADQQLLEYCRAGEFVSVLSTRQVGKSSLMARAAEQLTQDGARPVMLDLTQIGAPEEAEIWYQSLLTLLEDQLSLETNSDIWWKEHSQLSHTERLTLFFQKVVLVEITAPVVIFIDEIDYTLKLGYSDDFFAAIRYFYNGRVQIPEFKRLSFVLIGVASAADLITDPTRTPFNISKRVDLTDFSFEEALPLTTGFDLPPEKAEQILKWVLKWTGGHPYLTQCLCQAVAEEAHSALTETELDGLVETTFLGEKSEQNYNVQFVREMLTKRATDLSLPQVLTTYRAVWKGQKVLDEEQSLVKSHLKLSG
ncbi:MAG: AAA-like domain-containing protein, partial [Chloroflexota bacterium]